VRSSADIAPKGRSRRRIVIVVVLAVIVIVVFSLRTIASIYTDSLWYSSISSVHTNEHQVFSTMLETKVGLFLTLGLLFFLAMWVNLLLCNRLGPSELFLDAPEDELVRRFQGAVRPYAGRLYALLAFVFALIAASSAVSQWQNFLLFTHAKNFGIRDALNGKDIGFYIFKLPFITFIVDWVLASLFAIILVSVVFHYLNGGIRAARVSPRVSPAVKVHLSVLVALLAVAKAAGYLVARWHMVTSTTSGVVEGAGYTDVHARIPALTLLFWLCLAAAVILLVNIRQRGWTLPVIAIGLWAFVALVIGVIYPAALQAFKVTPAQSSLELPYIQRNITATRAAYDLNDITIKTYQPTSSAPVLTQPGVAQSLLDIRQWDPAASIAQSTFQVNQNVKNYYQISMLGEDRYMIDGKLTPVIEGLRELNPSGLSNQSWVNEHLQYTHGIGMVMAASNKNSSTLQPVYTESNVPPTSSNGFPDVTEPGIYFGLDQSGYVVADTKQPEINYPLASGSNFKDYSGAGITGVKLNNFFTKAMFAIRLGDLNLFLSNLVTSSSRLILVRNVVQIAQRAAPFLSIDAHPYAVIVGGHIDWVLDGYTTTDQYPYSQNASTQLVPSDNGLPSSYNYVRNSVKIVIDAYTGQVTLYDIDPSDPILNAWQSIFPDLFTPLSDMTPQLRAHLKYPEDIFSIQSAIFGRYHITSPSSFYANGDGWSLSPTFGAGPPPSQIEQVTQVNKGVIVSQTADRMDPLYQVYAPPGSSIPQYTLTDAFVSASASGTSSSANAGVVNLTAFDIAMSDPNDYGQITVYHPQTKTPINGPLLAEENMVAYGPASSRISLLNKEGSQVILGNVLMLPVGGSILYVLPMYVTSSVTNYPQLEDFITQYNQSKSFEPTLSLALNKVLASGASPSSPGTKGLTITQLLTRAQTNYTDAQTALSHKNLTLYQKDLAQENADLAKAISLLTGGSSTKHATSSPTTKT
jgi:uncharacterized protein